jgi:hypothetical protein
MALSSGGIDPVNREGRTEILGSSFDSLQMLHLELTRYFSTSSELMKK